MTILKINGETTKILITSALKKTAAPKPLAPQIQKSKSPPPHPDENHDNHYENAKTANPLDHENRLPESPHPLGLAWQDAAPRPIPNS